MKRKYNIGKKENDENVKKKRRRNQEDEKKEKEVEKMMKKEIEERTFKYIGETSRSAHERGEEHLRVLRDLNPGSHFLKHVIQHHMEDPENVEFRMKILTSHFTAFSRQITEAVKINRNKGPFLLNSKSEYNRSSLPNIKVGDKKSKWELSDISEFEMKDSIRILKNEGVKFRKTMCLEVQNDEKQALHVIKIKETEEDEEVGLNVLEDEFEKSQEKKDMEKVNMSENTRRFCREEIQRQDLFRKLGSKRS